MMQVEIIKLDSLLSSISMDSRSGMDFFAVLSVRDLVVAIRDRTRLGNNDNMFSLVGWFKIDTHLWVSSTTTQRDFFPSQKIF